MFSPTSGRPLTPPPGSQQPTTARKIDKRMLVDYEMKTRWEAAKDGKEKSVALIAVNELLPYDLNRAIHRRGASNGTVWRLVVIWMLFGAVGQCCQASGIETKDMEKTGAGPQRVKKSLGAMKRKLEFLCNAMENAQREALE